MANYRKSEDYDRMPSFRRSGIERHTCPSKTKQEVKITVPVEVRAAAKVGRIDIDCLGCPVIGENGLVPAGEHCATSRFTVSQRIRVEIPIVFEAEVEVGDERVHFEEPKEKCEEDQDEDEDQDQDEDLDPLKIA